MKEMNTALKTDEINTDQLLPNDSNSNIDEIEHAPQVGSIGTVENVLRLKKGSRVLLRVCLIFGFSLLSLGAIIPICVIYGEHHPYLFALFAIPTIGLFYSLFMVTCCNGFITVNPNEAVVLQFFGRYIGTVKENGFFFGYPMASHRRISLRSTQFNGNRLKVNERDGNPVELGIIVVWRIGDTAKAVFDVESYQDFIQIQSEAAIRYIGCKYPYDPVVPGEISLRSGHEIINKELKKELELRVKISGIIIEDARVTEISYGQEVAQMMLQKQASNATAFAKDVIVQGSASAVLKSLAQFEKNGCELTNEEKARYIISMMSTLCMSADVSKIMGNDK